MTMLEIYRGRKSRLTERLKESKSLFETASVISETFETMQYQYQSENPGTDSEKLGRALALLKGSFPLLESVNRTKLWENPENRAQKKKSPLPGLIALILGLAVVFLSVWYTLFLNKIGFKDTRNMYIALGVGCFVILLSGFMLFHRRRPKNKAVVEVSADPADIANRLEDAAKALDDMMDLEARRRKETSERMEKALSPDRVQLFSYLLEAKRSGDGSFRLEQLEEVERYLARRDVIVLNYSKGSEKYFDFLTGDRVKTLRPALVRDGKILAKGLAQVTRKETAQNRDNREPRE